MKNKWIGLSDRPLWSTCIKVALIIAYGILGFVYRDSILDRASKAANQKVAFHIVCVLLLCICLIVFEIRLPEKVSRVLCVLYAVISPLFIFLINEFIYSTGEDAASPLESIFGKAVLDPKMVFLNYWIIGLSVFFCTGILNNLVLGPKAACLFWTIFTIVNYYVTEFRGNAIIASDFATVSTAMDVLPEYRLTMTYRIYMGIALVLVFWFTGTQLKASRLVKKATHYLIELAVTIGVSVFCFVTFISGDYIREHYIPRVSYFFTVRSYHSHGIAATLARTLSDVFVVEPEGYSAELAQSIADRYTSDEASGNTKVSETNPNIFLIVNESFADLNLLGDFTTNKDVMPFLSTLDDNCVKGYTCASVLGGMTANTEFELLTGNTMGFMLPQVVPFQIYMNDSHPGLPAALAGNGYCGEVALHPGTYENYNRDQAYFNLGFKEYYCRETEPLPYSKIRKYCDDASTYENMLHFYEENRKESDQPYFGYTLTIQNHSPYQKSKVFEPDVFVDGLTDEQGIITSSMYLSLARVSDEAVEKVFHYLEDLDEPTLLIFLGDHQPSLADGFYQDISAPSKSVDDHENLDYYKVPFWIWANYDIEEKEDILTSMNYLQSLILETCHGSMTGFQKYLAELHEDIPVINAFGYVGNDGNFYEFDDKESPYYEKIHEYEILEYNAMFDTKNLVKDFYEYR